MAAVTAALIKELRDKTQAGMVDCKNALTECDGDLDKAVEFLRKKGLASANKRMDRVAKEGLVVIESADAGKTVYMIQVNCETDFVAKNDDFKKLVGDILAETKKTGKDSFQKDEALPATIDELLKGQIARTGENTQLGGFIKLSKTTPGILSTYVHLNNKIGVIAELTTSKDLGHSDVLEQLGKDICMQAAAMNPQYLNPTEIPEDIKNKEREIYREQLKDMKKPAPVLDKIIEGKLSKFYSEVCLTDQEFIKEGGKKISDLIAEKGKALGAEITLARFVRFQIGA
jgi:elongation factor Ts